MPTPTRARQQTLANPSPNCPHCRSTRLKLLLGFRGQQTFRCQNCQGYFNIPAHPTDRFYTSSYYEKIYTPRKTAQLEQSWRYLRITDGMRLERPSSTTVAAPACSWWRRMKPGLWRSRAPISVLMR